AAPAMITTDQAGGHGGYSESPRNRLTSGHPLNPDGDYVSAFGGTSSATPAVAGAIAVVLGVNPELTWRDVKHILASTARKIDPEIPQVRAAFDGAPYVAQHPWLTNAAGYDFHNWYGFGALDLDAAVAMAGSHLPDSLGPFVDSAWFDAGLTSPLDIGDADGAGATATVEVAGLPDAADIEAVVLEISADHPDAFELGVTVHSPAGTQSVVNPPFNAVLDGFPGLNNWHLLSNAFYGESPGGTWTIQVVDLASGNTGTVDGLRLRFYYGEHGG
ncbi:MAG: proprotein convertase P-domain-containing protein, partial [Gammaproteobacteria bacterium]|nr:proprotein convertase P-domain-containing protein [Gammaproteobacteria bacterium]